MFSKTIYYIKLDTLFIPDTLFKVFSMLIF